MNLVPSQVDDDAAEIEPIEDVMHSIIAEAESEHRAAFETMNGPGEETEHSQQANKPDGEGTSQRESAQYSDEGKKPGIDVLLKDVESQLGPEHAEVIRGLQRGYQSAREEVGDAQELRERLAELEGAFNERKSAGPAMPELTVPADPNDPINQMTDEQKELFQRLFDRQAEEQGYIRQDHLDKKQSEATARDFVDQDVAKGMEQWGERFGQKDAEGKFLFAEEVQQQTSEVFDRIYDPERGLSATDLYVLANWQSLLDEAKGQTAETQQTNQAAANRSRQRSAAITESRPRSTGQRRGPEVYKKGEPFGDTIARASAQSYRELPELS